jgi:hypothetical protein
MIGRAYGWLSGSRRRRRRLLWAGAVVVAAGSIASLVVFMRNGGQSFDAVPQRKGPVQVYHAPRTIPVTRSALEAAEATMIAFLRTAVRREHVADSFDLVTTGFRHGLTRDQWSRGEIPVVPYPADLTKVRYNVDYSYGSNRTGGPRRLGLELYATPKRGENVSTMIFAVELQAPDRAPVRRWRISYWEPQGVPGGPPARAGRPASEPPPDPSRLSMIWLLVPALALGGVVLVPLALVLRSVFRARRIQRMYDGRRRGNQTSTTSPS